MRKTYRKDAGRFELPAVAGTSHVATYTVVKLWEEDPAPILAMESPGLCPFLPLMRGKPRELFVESRRKIEGAPEAVLPENTRRLLLLVASAARDLGAYRRLALERARGGESAGARPP